MSIGGLAFAAAVNGLIAEWATLPLPFVAVYVALGIGGLGIVVGRVRDKLHIESAGYALLLGALVFVTFRNLSEVHTAGDVSGVLLNTAALVVGFGVRLYVVRRAVKAREMAAREVDKVEGPSGE